MHLAAGRSPAVRRPPARPMMPPLPALLPAISRPRSTSRPGSIKGAFEPAPSVGSTRSPALSHRRGLLRTRQVPGGGGCLRRGPAARGHARRLAARRAVSAAAAARIRAKAGRHMGSQPAESRRRRHAGNAVDPHGWGGSATGAQTGGVLSAPVNYPIRPQEIMRSLLIAVYRRADILGELAGDGSAIDEVGKALLRRPAPPTTIRSAGSTSPSASSPGPRARTIRPCRF